MNLKKAQAAVAYAGIGAIDGEDVREQLRRDKDSDYFGLAEDIPQDDDLVTELLQNAAPPQLPEM